MASQVSLPVKNSPKIEGDGEQAVGHADVRLGDRAANLCADSFGIWVQCELKVEETIGRARNLASSCLDR